VQLTAGRDTLSERLPASVEYPYLIAFNTVHRKEISCKTMCRKLSPHTHTEYIASAYQRPRPHPSPAPVPLPRSLVPFHPSLFPCSHPSSNPSPLTVSRHSSRVTLFSPLTLSWHSPSTPPHSLFFRSSGVMHQPWAARWVWCLGTAWHPLTGASPQCERLRATCVTCCVTCLGGPAALTSAS